MTNKPNCLLKPVRISSQGRTSPQPVPPAPARITPEAARNKQVFCSARMVPEERVLRVRARASMLLRFCHIIPLRLASYG